MVRRKEVRVSDSVRISIPSVTFVRQAASIEFSPSASTMQRRQEPISLIPGM